MVKVLSASDLRSSETAARFEGRDHGSSVSFFWSHHPPGIGVGLHHHPYEETFVIQEGVAMFAVDGEQVEARAGQIVIVPAGAVHGFVNSGDVVLHQVSIHPCDHVVQEFLDGSD